MSHYLFSSGTLDRCQLLSFKGRVTLRERILTDATNTCSDMFTVEQTRDKDAITDGETQPLRHMHSTSVCLEEVYGDLSMPRGKVYSSVIIIW